jgi:hypothetical protein
LKKRIKNQGIKIHNQDLNQPLLKESKIKTKKKEDKNQPIRANKNSKVMIWR